jgi:integrase
MRAGELAAMRVKNVDLMHRGIRVRESVAEVSGHLEYSTPKTEKGKREIGLSRSLVDLLTVQMAGKDRENFVFTRPSGAPLRHAN